MKKWFVGVCLLICAEAGATSEALVTVDQLLQRASKALQEQNYKGSVTYEFGNVLETLEVVHAVRDGKEYDRIRHLSGVEREFVRSGLSQDCVTVGHFLLRGGLASAGTDPVTLAQNYHFYIRGGDRIANRATKVIQAVPKDEYRFGMTIAVDTDSGLPLMSIVTAGSQTALERFQFVNIEVGGEISDSDLQPGFATSKSLDGSGVPCVKDQAEHRSAWQPGWLPPGFLLTHSSRDERDGEVLTFTDGIASFTLFIKTATEGERTPQGMARRGATVALLSVLQAQQRPFRVVLVGEVPTNTAQQVVSSLQFQP